MKQAALAKRSTATRSEVSAGCLDCGKPGALWTGGNAQGVAARHHDATGHRTWVNVYLFVRYGTDADDDRQHDIEDAITASKSGGRPEAAPLPDPDAPTVPAAGVSAPKGRSVETRRQMPRGARGRKPELTT